jgi:hypothetical protein
MNDKINPLETSLPASTATDTIVTRVLDDGTINTFDIEVCDDEAEKAVQSLWEQENKTINFDFTTAVYQLFLKNIGILTRSGFSTEELLDEVLFNSEAGDVCPCCGGLMTDHDDEDFDDDEDFEDDDEDFDSSDPDEK